MNFLPSHLSPLHDYGFNRNDGLSAYPNRCVFLQATEVPRPTQIEQPRDEVEAAQTELEKAQESYARWEKEGSLNEKISKAVSSLIKFNKKYRTTLAIDTNDVEGSVKKLNTAKTPLAAPANNELAKIITALEELPTVQKKVKEFNKALGIDTEVTRPDPVLEPVDPKKDKDDLDQKTYVQSLNTYNKYLEKLAAYNEYAYRSQLKIDETKIDPSKPAETVAYLVSIIQEKIRRGDPLYDKLTDVITQLAPQRLEAAKAGAIKAPAKRLSAGRTLMEAGAETGAQFKGKPGYKEAKGLFDSALADPELRGFLRVPGTNELSAQRQRESEQLFFSILGAETNNFSETNFILGERFGNDPEANRKNFPFIYNEWLKNNGGTDLLETLKQKSNGIKDAQKDIANLIPQYKTVAGLIGNDNRATAPNIPPLVSLTIPTVNDNGITAEGGYAQHKSCLSAMETVQNDYIKLSNEDRFNEAQKAQFKGKKEALEVHIKLEKAKIAYYDFKINEEKARKTFTQAELSEKKPWLMRTVMKKFQKAMEIVDKFNSNLNPAIRRLLIAMVYYQGVSQITIDAEGSEVLRDDLMEDYEWMLTSLVQSPAFNQFAEGKFFVDNPAKKEFLLALQQANMVKTRLKEKRDKLKRLQAGLMTEGIPVPEKPANGKEYLVAINGKRDALFNLGKNTTDYNSWREKGSLKTDKQALQEKISAYTTTTLGSTDNPYALQLKVNEESIKNPDDTSLQAIKTALDTLMPQYQQVARFGATTTEGGKILKQMKFINAQEDIEKDEAFVEYAEKYIKNPTSPEASQFIETAKRRGSLSEEEREKLEAFTPFHQSVELNYNALDLQERSQMNVFEHMNISLVNFYEGYLQYIGEHPEMKMENWNSYFNMPDKFDSLLDLFRATLADTKGKEDFLKVFAGMKGLGGIENLGNVEPKELREAQGAAFMTFKSLQIEIDHRNKVAEAARLGKAELEAQLKGMTFADKITNYGKSVLNMLIGPGQSLGNRVAGGIAVLAALKMFGKVWSGEGSWGKIGWTVLGLGAAEVIMKNTTGRGIMDRFNIADSTGKAAEGTYEAVLVQRSEEKMAEKGIAPEQHTAALHELNHVPFRDVMKWYAMTKQDGTPLEGHDDMFDELGVSTKKIVGEKVSWKKADRNLQARRIMHYAVEDFFDYVEAKDNKYNGTGQAILQERWIDSIFNPDFKMENAKYTRFELSAGMKEAYRTAPDGLTWEVVMSSEISPEEAKATEGQTVDGKMAGWLGEQWKSFETWTRINIIDEFSVAAADFFATLPNRGRDLKEWLGEMGELGAQKLDYTGRSITLWYGAHKLEIFRFGNTLWEVTKAGVLLPFKVMYAGAEWVLPLGLVTIKQTEAILERNKFITQQTDLTREQIMRNAQVINLEDGTSRLVPHAQINHVGNPLPVGYEETASGSAIWRVDAEKMLDQYRNNGEWRHFGFFQVPFHKAYDAGYETDGTKKSSQNAFYESKADPANRNEDGMPGVGYYISEIDAAEAEVANYEGASPAELYWKMLNASHKKAKEFYLDKYPTLLPEEIDEYMYAIHTVSKTPDERNGKPAKMYRFWRMPLPVSQELQLKRSGRWADYDDPNRYKDRPPFIVDPNKSLIENFKDAYGFNNPGVRKVFAGVGKLGALWLGMGFSTLETIGDITTWTIDTLVPRATAPKWIEAITKRDEQQLQLIDEISTTAESPALALSKFYKNPTNAELYKKALAESRVSGKNNELDLESVTGWVEVSGCYYNGQHNQKCKRLNTDWYTRR